MARLFPNILIETIFLKETGLQVVTEERSLVDATE
jgi:hypothetical protein